MIQTITLDLPRSLWWSSNEQRNLHHHDLARRSRHVRELARNTALDAGLYRVERCRLTVTASIPTARRFDPNNIAGTVAKHAIDGMTDAGVWEDDDSEHVVFTGYQRGPKTGVAGMYRLTIDIEEAS